MRSGDARRPGGRSRVDIVAVFWSVIFVIIAAVCGWLALGRPIPWSSITLAVPLTMIVVGLLGLRLSTLRRNT